MFGIQQLRLGEVGRDEEVDQWRRWPWITMHPSQATLVEGNRSSDLHNQLLETPKLPPLAFCSLFASMIRPPVFTASPLLSIIKKLDDKVFPIPR